MHPHPIAPRAAAVVIRVQERRHGRPRHAHDAEDIVGQEGPGGEPGQEEEEYAGGGAGVGAETLEGCAGCGVRVWKWGCGGFGAGRAGAGGVGEVPGGVAEV